MKVLGEKIERFLDIVGNVCEVVCWPGNGPDPGQAPKPGAFPSPPES